MKYASAGRSRELSVDGRVARSVLIVSNLIDVH